MDLPAARAILDLSRSHRRRLLLLAAAAIAGYGAYRLYHHPSVAERRRRLSALLRVAGSVAGALCRSAEAASLVSSDLSRFLSSDSDEIPNSLRQLSKIARCDDFAAALSRASEAVAAGLVRGSGATSGPASPSPSGSAADRVLDKVFSPAGTGFVSVVAGSFARNLVLAFYDSNSPATVGGDAKPVPEWVRVMCSNEARKVTGEWVQTFVATAVEVYLRKTMDVNTYDEMFAGLTNPSHAERMKEVLVTVSKGAVETLVRTSHEVLTSSRPSTSPAEGEIGPPCAEEGRKCEEDVPPPENSLNSTMSGGIGDGGGGGGGGGGEGGLLKGVSTALAVPGNRRFVLDVTGRVTFETVKSVLDFTFQKMYDSTRSGMRSVRKEIAEMGMEVMRYASARSMFILVVCFSMLLHLAFGSRLLVTA